ncbi:DUF4062 domain-containing protein [Notoacmeibacter ruber]|uniref:DUF4062 domain-containing protein n=1 Tax=Notoacmeibacter ruber TaxID=2670375 RepID=A0A3L7JC56_9HYPH|nr:DUF4062 domain-containing protein [Notoacmeibacter ruber]RLQ88044.1 DUF4062 domain-containing protein [Notoacmeibacter ruber]
MKIFLSSVMRDFEDDREAAFRAIRMIGHQIIRAEDFDPSSTSPRNTCLRGVRESDLVILLLGERYGFPQASGLSATHEEFREAAGTKDLIVYIKNMSNREPDQQQFVEEVQKWENGCFTGNYDHPSELTDKLVGVLHRKSLENAAGQPDDSILKKRAISMLAENSIRHNNHRAFLEMAVAVGPEQQILRPSQIDAPELKDFMFSLLFSRASAFFDRNDGSKMHVVDDNLICEQHDRSVTIYPNGDILMSLPIESNNTSQMAIIQENILDQIEMCFSISDMILKHTDETERIRRVAPAVNIHGADHWGWRTRGDANNNPNGIKIRIWGTEPTPVLLQPAVRPRAVLSTQKSEMAEDLTVLLSRQF